MMSVDVATITSAPNDGAAPYVPPGDHRGHLADFDYVEEEWFASGVADGRPYATTLFVRRPRDRARFSGTVIVEPLHAMGATPVWMYVAQYAMGAGHASAVVGAQKTALEQHVKPFAPARYESLHIDADPPPPDAPEVDALRLPVGDPAAMEAFFKEMQRRNAAASTILAQVGAAIAGSAGPFDGWNVAKVILAGHSQTGGVVTEYLRRAHATERRADGTSVYDGYFPSGAAAEAFTDCEVPLLQVLSEGDISDPNRRGPLGARGLNRAYRRADSDEPGDRYRLYELAGVAHMGTRNPPYNDPSWWPMMPTAGDISSDARMNSLPHNELFGMAMCHLVAWVNDGVAPPRADRIEVGADGYFAKDERGNSLGGVRNVYVDVPVATYYANPRNADGTPAFGVVGTEEPLDRATLRGLYADHADYVAHFNRRLDELVTAGWFLAEDADDLRADADKADVP
jgi:hypothetical protein